MTLVAAVPVVQLAVVIAKVSTICTFSASAAILAATVVFIVVLCMPVSLNVSVFLITTITIMVSKSCVLPQAQKQCHACNQ